MSYACPVCGFPDLTKQPRTEASGGSYEICPSCGFQFGVTDEDKGFSFGQWRTQWVENGMPWATVAERPSDWDPERQLRAIDQGDN